MEGQGDDFQDWEVLLNNSDETSLVNSSDSAENMTNFQSESSSGGRGIIRSDYFSLDSHARTTTSSVLESHNPIPTTRVDPEEESFWSDSTTHHGSKIYTDFDVKNELGFPKNGKNEPGFQGIGEIEAESEKNSEMKKFQQDTHTTTTTEKKKYDNGIGINSEEEEEGNLKISISSTKEKAAPQGSEEKKNTTSSSSRNVVWWKLPLELLNYCVLRVNPPLGVWTFSVAAAALMGFVILGRRLHNMKRKTRSLQLKVTVDDKKVSQFMSRAARLNEAFSVVRRVPVVRSAMPPAGVTPWPVLSLR